MIKGLRWGFACALILIFAPIGVEAAERDLERGFQALSETLEKTIDIADVERGERVERKYRQLFSSYDNSALPALENADLDSLFRATRLVARFTNNRAYVRDLEAIVGELRSRGLAEDEHLESLYGIYLIFRMFEEARELSASSSRVGLDPVPQLIDRGSAGGAPTELIVDQRDFRLLRRPVDLESGAVIVVVAHPLCGFSRNAMLTVAADPVLAPIFDTHAHWIAPVDRTLDFELIRRWNVEHPGVDVTLAYAHDEWPEFDSWATPAFYFLRDGKVEDKVEGWPDGGRRQELLRALRTIELLPPEQDLQAR